MSVHTDITSFAVALPIKMFTAVKTATIDISNATIDILFIIVYNEVARVLGLSPFPLSRLFLLIMYGDYRCDNGCYRGNHCAYRRNPLVNSHCVPPFLI